MVSPLKGTGITSMGNMSWGQFDTHILIEEILRMVTGSDYIGIVPDYHFPRYCHSLFPPEDRIIDFMNLGYEDTEDIIKYAYWYPV